MAGSALSVCLGLVLCVPIVVWYMLNGGDHCAVGMLDAVAARSPVAPVILREALKTNAMDDELTGAASLSGMFGVLILGIFVLYVRTMSMLHQPLDVFGCNLIRLVVGALLVEGWRSHGLGTWATMFGANDILLAFLGQINANASLVPSLLITGSLGAQLLFFDGPAMFLDPLLVIFSVDPFPTDARSLIAIVCTLGGGLGVVFVAFGLSGNTTLVRTSGIVQIALGVSCLVFYAAGKLALSMLTTFGLVFFVSGSLLLALNSREKSNLPKQKAI